MTRQYQPEVAIAGLGFQTRTTLFGFVFSNQLPRLYCKISALRCLRFG